MPNQRSQWNRGHTMSSTSLVDKSSEPELEGNIRTMVWADASARQTDESKDDQMSPGDLVASLREVSRASIDEVDILIHELQNAATKTADRPRTDRTRHCRIHNTKLTSVSINKNCR
jgi:hypothetical protein